MDCNACRWLPVGARHRPRERDLSHGRFITPRYRCVRARSFEKAFIRNPRAFVHCSRSIDRSGPFLAWPVGGERGVLRFRQASLWLHNGEAGSDHRNGEPVGIFNDAASPVAGNPKGDVTLVEFFDYNCPYCRKAAPIIEELARGDPNLRLVFKEFPILGPGSTFAARAALASQKQDKYLAFHNAMMAYPGSIRETSTLEVAANVGLDVARLREDMEDPAIKQSIDRNLALAEDLRITGTPSFVAGKEIARGLADLEAMKELIAKARQSKEK
jgi:protein-disulfide isomerase